MNDMLTEGFNLMLMGMGAVFVFLTLLVFTTSLMSKLVGKYAPKPAASDTAGASTAPAPASQGDDPQLLAVITAAIQKHRSRHK